MIIMDRDSYSPNESNNNANMSLVYNANLVNSPHDPTMSDRSPLLPLYHHMSYLRNYVVPGSDDDHLRLIYLYLIFPIIMFFYLLYSYLSFTTPLFNNDANQYTFVAVGTICLLSTQTTNVVRMRFNEQHKWKFKLVVAWILIHLIFILLFVIIFVYLYGELALPALAHLYKFPLWLIRVPACYIIYHITYGVISGCTGFLFMRCLWVRATLFEYLLESKSRKTPIY